MKKCKTALALLSMLFLSIATIISIYAQDNPSQEQVERFISNLSPAVRQLLQEKGIDLDKLKTDRKLQKKVRRMLENPEFRLRMEAEKFIDSISPEARQFLQEKGIDLNKLKTDKQLQDKVRKMMENPEFRRRVFKMKERTKPVATEQKRRNNRKNEELPSYYEVIIRKNLFYPLGWTDKRTGPSWVLSGVVRSEEKNRALIQRQGSPEGYYVGIGDTIADGYKVEEITEDTVKLKKDKEEILLKLSDWVPRGGSAKPSFAEREPSSEGGKEEERKEPQLPSEFRPPPGVPRAMIEEILEKEGLSLEEVMRNPELQEKLKRKYEPVIRERMQNR